MNLNDALEKINAMKDVAAFNITGDMMDQSEFWVEDPVEFLENFLQCIQSPAGRKMMEFMIGESSIEDYIVLLASQID